MIRKRNTFRDLRAAQNVEDEEDDIGWTPPPPPKPRVEPVRESDMKTFTRLHIAATSGLSCLIEDLLKEGAFVDAKEDISGRTPLHIAASLGDLDGMVELLKGGAHIEAKTKSMETPLFLAVLAGQTAAVSFLLQHGAVCSGTIGLYGYHMIHAAARQGSLENFQILETGGASLTLQDGIGQQPIHYAAIGGSVDVIKYILTKLGSKVLQAGDRVFKRTPLQLAAREGHLKAVQLLLMIGDDQERTDMAGFTSLHHAILGDHVEVVQALALVDCNLEAKDVDGKTPLHLAAATNKLDCLQLLISKGANLKATDKNGQTPLDMAKDRQLMEAVHILCPAHADPISLVLDKMCTTSSPKLLYAVNTIKSAIIPGAIDSDLTLQQKDNRPTPDNKLYPLWCKIQALKMAQASTSSIGSTGISSQSSHNESAVAAAANEASSRFSISSIPANISKKKRSKQIDEPSLGVVSTDISGDLSLEVEPELGASKLHCRQMPNFGQRPRTAMTLSSDPDFTDTRQHPRFNKRRDDALRSARTRQHRTLIHGGYFPILDR